MCPFCSWDFLSPLTAPCAGFVSVLFTLMDAFKIEYGTSEPLIGTVDIIRDPGETEGLVQRLDS